MKRTAQSGPSIFFTCPLWTCFFFLHKIEGFFCFFCFRIFFEGGDHVKPEDAELRKRMREIVDDQTLGRSELRKRLKDLLETNGTKTEKGRSDENG